MKSESAVTMNVESCHAGLDSVSLMVRGGIYWVTTLIDGRAWNGRTWTQKRNALRAYQHEVAKLRARI